MSKREIQVFQPSLGDDELAAVSRVFTRNWPGRGEEVRLFELEFANFLSQDYQKILTTNSCTEAIFQILNLITTPGDEVILPTISFVGAANAIYGQGLKPIFCDVDSLTGNATLEEIKKVVTHKTKVILVQHFGGIPLEIKELADWAQAQSIFLIEDAAGAIGSTYMNKHCGTFGDFGVWSLDSMKMIVAGDGGIIFAKSAENAALLRERTYMGLSNISGSSSSGQQKRWWEFDVSFPGRRSIMNDISASIARVQLGKLGENMRSRKRNAQLYLNLLSQTPSISLPMKNYMNNSSHYFFPIFVSNAKRDELAEYLKNEGIYTTFRYFPLNRVQLYGAQGLEFLGSDLFTANTLLLPQHNGLTIDDIDFISSTLNRAPFLGMQ